MNLRLLPIVIAILTISIAGCKKDNLSYLPNDWKGKKSTGKFDNASCDFLKVGNEWTYDQFEFAGSSVRETKIISFNNGTYTVHQIINSGTPTVQYWITDGDYLAVYESGESESQARAIFKCGGVVGDNWSIPSTSVENGTVYYEIVAVNDSVNTSAGRFNTTQLEISFSYAINTQDNYWSNDFGLVYQEGLLLSLDLTNKNF